MRFLLVALAVELAASEIPAAIQAPPGTKVGLRLYAQGTQDYACEQAADAGSAAWNLTGPDATLFDAPDGGRVMGRHFAGPTWELATDHSRFEGDAKLAKSAPAPSGPADVKWLWVPRKRGASVDGALGRFTAVQRIETEGGVAPASSCARATLDAGAVVKVPYRATYLFY